MSILQKPVRIFYTENPIVEVPVPISYTVNPILEVPVPISYMCEPILEVPVPVSISDVLYVDCLYRYRLLGKYQYRYQYRLELRTYQAAYLLPNPVSVSSSCSSLGDAVFVCSSVFSPYGFTLT